MVHVYCQTVFIDHDLLTFKIIKNFILIINIYMILKKKLLFSLQIEKVGVFRTNQFWVKIGNLDLIKTLDVQTSFTSSYHQPLCQINPTCRGTVK